jgi:hypothetical protein
MKTKYLFGSLLTSLLLFSYSLMAQSINRHTICSTGGSGIIDGALISQTIGQSYNTTANYGNGISYRPGFQQPAGTHTYQWVDYKFTLFPIPVTKSLTIQAGLTVPKAIITAFDLNGKMVYSSSFTNLTTCEVDCQRWTNGSYVFSISDGTHLLYSAKVLVFNY